MGKIEINQELLNSILPRIKSLPNQEERDYLMKLISNNYAWAGEYTDSLNIINDVNDVILKESAYDELIDHMINNGDYEKALEVLGVSLKAIENKSEYIQEHTATVLYKIAFDKLRKGKIEDVIKSLDQIKDIDSKNILINEIINVLLKDNKIHQAEELLNEIKDDVVDDQIGGFHESVKDLTKISIIKAKAVAGDIDQAIKESESFDKEASKLRALLMIAFTVK